MKSKTEGLTDAQEEYIRHIVYDGMTQRQAYRAAYPGSVKWKDTAVDTRACTLFNFEKVKRRYVELKEALRQQTEAACAVSASDVMRELAAIAFSDAAGFAKINKKMDAEGREIVTLDFTPTDDLDDAHRRAMQGVKVGQGGIEVKSYDKLKALELLGRALGMLTDKYDAKISADVKQTVTLEDKLALLERLRAGEKSEP